MAFNNDETLGPIGEDSASSPEVIILKVVTKVFADSPYSAVNGDVVLCNAVDDDMGVNLPAANTNNQITVTKIDASANTVTVNGDGSQTINGELNQTITAQWVSLTFVSDGSNWFIK